MENSSTEDVKQFIRREMRLQNLDSFLLFISSASGFFFSFIYVFLGYIEIAVGFIPIIIFGTVIPIYIGYIRGAILLDNLEERVRGWIYLITGVAIYIAFVLVVLTGKLIGEFPSPFKDVLTGLWPFVGGFLLGFFLAKGKLGDRFSKHIFKVFNHEATVLTDQIYQETEDSTFYVAMYVLTSLMILLSKTSDASNWFIFFLFNSLALVAFRISEKRIRNFVVFNKHSKFLDVKRELIRSSKPRLKAVGFISAIIGAALFGFAPILEIPLPASTSRLIATAFVLAGSVMLIISKAGHEIMADFKKDVYIPEEVKKEIELVFERMKLRK